MNKNGTLEEQDAFVLANHFVNEHYENIERYIMIACRLLRHNSANKYLDGEDEDCWYEIIKGTYKELCVECDGDYNKMIDRCKEDNDLREIVFGYAIICLSTYLRDGLVDLNNFTSQGRKYL